MRRVALYLGITYLVLMAALIGLVGCSQANTAGECFRIDDCGEDSICFLGSCQDKGYSIQSVYAELNPPTDTGYLRQQTSVPLNVSQGYQLIVLEPTLLYSGKVVAPDVTHTGLLAAKKRDTLKTLDVIHRATVQTGGDFQLLVTPGSYDLSFAPYSEVDDDERLPPLGYGEVSILADNAVELAYPATDSLLHVTGKISYSVEASVEAANATVSATAQNSYGDSVVSSTATTDSLGSYELVFPPDVLLSSVAVHIGGSTTIPETTVIVQNSPENPLCLRDIVLGVGQTSIAATVVGGDGAIVPNASVFFEATEVGEVKGTFSARVDSDEQGAVVTSVLIPGTYLVTVVPAKSSSYAISSTRVTVAAEQSSVLQLAVGMKVRVEGTIRTHEGTPVAAAHITFGLRDAPITRAYDVDTDADGRYSTDVDPGEYEVQVEATMGSPLPSHRVFKTLTDADSVFDIRLYSPDFVFGSVQAPDGTGVVGVGITLYSSEFTLDHLPLVVGVGVSGPRGEFVIPIPRPDGN